MNHIHALVTSFFLLIRVSLRTYSFIAFLTVATLGLSNTAVAYLNFPTFNMFKSCKLIPVMIGSMIILKKKYNHIDKLAVLCMVVGLIFFTMADTKLHPNFEFFGVSLVMGALVAGESPPRINTEILLSQSA